MSATEIFALGFTLGVFTPLFMLAISAALSDESDPYEL